MKTGRRASVSGVRIPPHPPFARVRQHFSALPATFHYTIRLLNWNTANTGRSRRTCDSRSQEQIEAAMQTSTSEQSSQIRAATAALQSVLRDALLAVYLHGSAVSGGLQPQSDIDLLAIVDRAMSDDQRNDLMRALLRISARHPAVPGGPRCVEVMVFVPSDLSENSFPARAEFIYGEWLRDEFEATGMPMPTRDPEHTLVLAQARQEAISLVGQGAAELLPEISLNHLRQAMADALPALLRALRGDERNVLLTLARMWCTASTGEFVTKDAAAAWAIPQMADQDAATLDYARRAYLGEIIDEWRTRWDDTRRLAEHLRERVAGALRPHCIERLDCEDVETAKTQL